MNVFMYSNTYDLKYLLTYVSTYADVSSKSLFYITSVGKYRLYIQL